MSHPRALRGVPSELRNGCHRSGSRQDRIFTDMREGREEKGKRGGEGGRAGQRQSGGFDVVEQERGRQRHELWETIL
jgi:hypothetical protein